MTIGTRRSSTEFSHAIPGDHGPAAKGFSDEISERILEVTSKRDRGHDCEKLSESADPKASWALYMRTARVNAPFYGYSEIPDRPLMSVGLGSRSGLGIFNSSIVVPAGMVSPHMLFLSQALEDCGSSQGSACSSAPSSDSVDSASLSSIVHM